ncbi:MAG: SIS domain-containing protein [Candidatus Limnocylindrales bacterium]
MVNYVAEIRDQPARLAALLESNPASAVGSLELSRFRRVVLSGMGASHYATYPAWLTLAAAGVPAWWLEADELLHHASGLVGPDTLLWLTSQSGYSAEIQALVDGGARGGALVAVTNDPASPLAAAADVLVDIHAGHEETVSTKSYTNSLVAALLLAQALLGTPDPRVDLARSIEELERFLGKDWERNLDATSGAVDRLEHVVVLARGAALHAAWTGALILKEAVRCPAEGMSAGQFRHGPLEIAGPMLTSIVVEGPPGTAALNRTLAQELVGAGSRVAWIGGAPPRGTQSLPSPAGYGIGARVGEILPFQLLTVTLARRLGIEPGEFLHSSKVTLSE